MGNITQGASRGHAAPALALTLLPRFPAFVSTGLLPPASRCRRNSASSSRSFASRKRPHPVGGRSSLGRAVTPAEADISSPAYPRSLRQDNNHDDGDSDDSIDAVAQATLCWVRSTVVGLNLCPWAGGALLGGRMQVLVYPALPAKPLLFPAAAATAADASDATSLSSSSAREDNSEHLMPHGDVMSSSNRDGASKEDPLRHFGSNGSSEGQRQGFRQQESGQRESSRGAMPSGGETPRDIDEENGEEEDSLSHFDGLVEMAARQAGALAALRGEAAANATTLVVARPPLAQDFEDFLDVVDAVDEFLDDAGLRGTVQLATFHPRYRFEGSEEDDASNYTNRSPYPVLHLLLENQFATFNADKVSVAVAQAVSSAVEQIGDPAKVWQRNVETTRKLGVEAMRRGVEACLTAATPMGKGTGGGEDAEGEKR